MVAPEVASVMVTVCAEVKVPPLGVITGVAAMGSLMVYAAVATALGLSPGERAIALMVSDLETVMGAVHCGEDIVATLPSVVQ